jgi:hypothetical protein
MVTLITLSTGAAGRSPSATATISHYSTEGYLVEVVGESHYQNGLERVCGGRTCDDVEKFCTASLVLEAPNLYDRNAVRIDTLGETVGYLSRDRAKALQAASQGVGTLGRPQFSRGHPGRLGSEEE